MGFGDRAIRWLIGVLSNMLNSDVIKQKLGFDVAVSNEMVEALRLWSLMYENQSPWLGKDLKSLGLAAAISSEFSRSIAAEMVMEVEGSARADYLQEQIDGFFPKIRQVVEVGVAKGGLVFKPYISGDKILVDFVQANQFIPVEFDVSGNISGCVFSDQRMIGKHYFTRLESHIMEGEDCKITNRAFKCDSKNELGREISLSEVQVWEDLKPEAVIKGVGRPLFSYFRYPAANTIDPYSPLGASCYSRAVDLIEQADQIWTDLLWEFESGQRALFIDVLAFGKDDKGRAVLPNKRLYRSIESGSAEGEFFQEWSPEFREQSILSGLDSVLKKIEFNVGLAYGTISDPTFTDKTATEIVTSRQRSYVTVAESQVALQRSMESLIEAMNLWASIGKLAPEGDYSTKFDFDDSIIVDKDAQLLSDMQLVAASIMSKVEFRMRNFGEDEATAKKRLQEVTEETKEQMALEQEAEGGVFGED